MRDKDSLPRLKNIGDFLKITVLNPERSGTWAAKSFRRHSWEKTVRMICQSSSRVRVSYDFQKRSFLWPPRFLAVYRIRPVFGKGHDPYPCIPYVADPSLIRSFTSLGVTTARATRSFSRRPIQTWVGDFPADRRMSLVMYQFGFNSEPEPRHFRQHPDDVDFDAANIGFHFLQRWLKRDLSLRREVRP